MQPMLNITLCAARSAGELIFRLIERLDIISVNEEDAKDYTTEVDRVAKQTIVAALRRAYPTHAIIGEEGGFIEGSGEDVNYLWVINLLDDTTNFIHGVPYFAVSIACKCKSHLEHAVVLDLVRQGKLTASRGRGAALNGRRLRVNGRKSLEGILFGIGSPFHDNQTGNLDNYLNMPRSLINQAAGIRRASAANLDLAYVTAGRYDAFQEFSLSGWDMAAGAPLVQEAGGLVGDFTGSHESLEKGRVVAGNTKYLKALLTTIQSHLPLSLKR